MRKRVRSIFGKQRANRWNSAAIAKLGRTAQTWRFTVRPWIAARYVSCKFRNVPTAY